jgi:LPXTG-site transpeptidase (sortase) family protein
MNIGWMSAIVVSVLVARGPLTLDSATGPPDPARGGRIETSGSIQAADAPPTRVVIPAIGVDTVILDVPRTSDSWDTSHLTWQAGHMAGTAYPGQGSNVVVVAHRYLSYDPATAQPANPGAFVALDQLRPGDTVRLYAGELVYVYEVTEQTVVARAELWVIGPTEGETLTLMTCGGTWDTGQLAFDGILVVRARLAGVNVAAEEVFYETSPVREPVIVERETAVDSPAGGLAKAASCL